MSSPARIVIAAVITVVLAGFSLSASADASPAPRAMIFHQAAGNPGSNIGPSPGYPSICESDPAGSTCEDLALAALNNARYLLGQPSYSLPAGFQSMPIGDQYLALVNSDRSVYGLPAVSGLNATLNAAAQAAIGADTDPIGPTYVDGAHFTAWASNWGAGWASGLYIYYLWMYDDGAGSPNIDCPYAGAAGCWGHRQTVLADFGASVLALGVGSGISPHYGAMAFTALVEGFPAGSTISTLAPAVTGRVAAIVYGNAMAQEASSSWITEYNGVKQVATDGVRLGVLTTGGDLLIKEGSLYGSWVAEASNVTSFSLSGQRIGVVQTDGRVSVKEGGLLAGWIAEADGATQIELSGSRIAIVSTGKVLAVKEGGLLAGWVFEATQVTSVAMSGSRLGVVQVGGGVAVKEGNLLAGWVPLAGATSVLALAGLRVGVVQTNGSVSIKEGSLYSGWVTVANNTTQLTMTPFRIAVLSPAGAVSLKDGGLYSGWTTVATGASQIDIS